MSEGVRVALLWLGLFGLVHAGFLVCRLVRLHTDRQVVDEVIASRPNLVQAAHLADPREADALAVRLLLAGGAVRVDADGLILPTGEPAPALDSGSGRAALEALRDAIGARPSGTKLYEVREPDPEFAGYRRLRDEAVRRIPHEARIGRMTDSSRIPVGVAAFVLMLGMGLHALTVSAPVPWLGDGGWWIFAWIPLWGLATLTAFAWPDGDPRPGLLRLRAYCGDLLRAALGEEDPASLAALRSHAYRSSRSESWWERGGADGDAGSSCASSCGSGCGGD
ncbi:hypothetical protein AB0A69_11290 [Streptomyces sp. NPDC045431]|uniref:hypothetical protein n=1 Tax=Streptomyces sp. NPDC045431 TaxID=3155613 RepID=UPI0034003762